MPSIERCVGCQRVRMGDHWYLEGALTAVELTVHEDTWCPSCERKKKRKEDEAQGDGLDSNQ